MICASLALLQIMFAVHRFAQGATAPATLRVADCPQGNAYKVSVTGFTFSVIWHEKHYVDQPPPVAFSPLWCLTAPPSLRGIGRATKGKRLYGQARRLTSPDLHILCRMCTVDNKALKSSPFISGSTSKHGLFCHHLRGKSREAGKGEAITQAECGWPVLRRPSGRLYGFIQTGAFYNLEAPTSTL